jgi:hypothetical protein
MLLAFTIHRVVRRACLLQAGALRCTKKDLPGNSVPLVVGDPSRIPTRNTNKGESDIGCGSVNKLFSKKFLDDTYQVRMQG